MTISVVSDKDNQLLDNIIINIKCSGNNLSNDQVINESQASFLKNYVMHI